MALSYANIEGLWIQAGGSPALAPLAAAIAMAESGGNPNAHNAKPPDDSYGLWQINMIGSLGPARRKTFGISSNTALYDPLTNAKAAVAVSGNKSFAAWSTFGSGAYKRYLNGSVPPDMNAGGATGGTGSDGGAVQASVQDSIMSSVYKLANVAGNMVVEGGALVGGGILVAAGLYMLFRGTDVTGAGAAISAIRTVGGPVGKAIVK